MFKRMLLQIVNRNRKRNTHKTTEKNREKIKTIIATKCREKQSTYLQNGVYEH